MRYPLLRPRLAPGCAGLLTAIFCGRMAAAKKGKRASGQEAVQALEPEEGGFVKVATDEGGMQKWALPEDQQMDKAAKVALAHSTIAPQIGCFVCEVAASVIASEVSQAVYRTEEDLLRDIGEFCKGSSPGSENSLGSKLQRQRWQIWDRGKEGYKLEPAAKDGSNSSLDHHVFRWAVEHSCGLSLNGQESELAEWLYVARKKGVEVKADAISEKLCQNLSGVCKKELKETKGKGSRRKRSHEL